MSTQFVLILKENKINLAFSISTDLHYNKPGFNLKSVRRIDRHLRMFQFRTSLHFQNVTNTVHGK